MSTRRSSVRKVEDLLIPATLPETKLPTYEEVHNYYSYLEKRKPEESKYALRLHVIDKVCQMWSSINIPTCLAKSVINKLTKWCNRYEALLLNERKRPNSENLKTRITQFMSDGKNLFDIAKCQCSSAITCKCPQDSKIQINVRNFLNDQRQERKMSLLQAKRMIDDLIPSTSRCNEDIPQMETQVSDITSVASNLSLPPSKPEQMRFNLSNLVAAIDRTGVSQRNAAIIANAVLQDVHLITAENMSMVIDKAKIAREQKIYHERLLNRQPVINNMIAIYFDGRKDKTLVNEKKGNKFYRREVREEHVTLLQEPNEKYLTHISPSSSTAQGLCESIYIYLQDSGIDMSTIGNKITYLICINYAGRDSEI